MLFEGGGEKDMTVRTRVMTEGLLLFLIGVGGIAEGYRLVVFKDPQTLYDVLGPGYYIVVVSLAMVATAIAHLAIHLKDPETTAGKVDKKERMRLFYMIGSLVLYLILLNFLGYFLSTFIFFLLEFWLLGFKWKTNIILTFVVTIIYYLVFIEYCSMVFPRGIVESLLGR